MLTHDGFCLLRDVVMLAHCGELNIRFMGVFLGLGLFGWVWDI